MMTLVQFIECLQFVKQEEGFGAYLDANGTIHLVAPDGTDFRWVLGAVVFIRTRRFYNLDYKFMPETLGMNEETALKIANATDFPGSLSVEPELRKQFLEILGLKEGSVYIYRLFSQSSVEAR